MIVPAPQNLFCLLRGESINDLQDLEVCRSMNHAAIRYSLATLASANLYIEHELVLGVDKVAKDERKDAARATFKCVLLCAGKCCLVSHCIWLACNKLGQPAFDDLMVIWLCTSSSGSTFLLSLPCIASCILLWSVCDRVWMSAGSCCCCFNQTKRSSKRRILVLELAAALFSITKDAVDKL